MIRCRALGPCVVTVDGAEPPAELQWKKHLALLIYLARSPHHARTREHLIGVLWGDRPEASARHSLREAVHVLRRAAGGGVEADAELVRLADGTVELDVEQLEALAAREDWEAAAALAGGEFLEGFSVPDAPPFEDWLAAERTAWRRRTVDVLLARAQQLLRGGRPAESAEHARRALALDPVSEPAAAAAMLALALAGERAHALATFERFAEHLRADMGGEPGDDLHRLAERVRLERTWRLPPEADAAIRRGAESRRAPLVGRGEELTALITAWEHCRRDRTAAVAFVDGDPGVGKTRLAEEVLARARLAGAAAAAARAVAADRTEPGSALAGLANGGLLEAPGIAAAPPEALAALAARLPAWGDRFPEARRAAPSPIGRAFTDVLRACADEQPVLLVLDDAHWADGESLLAMDAAVRDLAAFPVFALLTAAPYAERAELDSLRARLGRDVRGCSVRLEALSTEQLRTLTCWAMPDYDDDAVDRLTRRVAADSAGLPLLAVELLHAVALGLDLKRSERAWPAAHHTLDQSLPGDLAAGVVAAIRMGYRRLSKPAQTLLAAASVLDDRVSAQVLERATGLTAGDAAAALDELEWQRWLVAEGRGYGFVARIVRDVVARDMLTEGQRRRLIDAARGTLLPA